PITLFIITILFSVQHYGTRRVGKSFGPVMLVWFLMLGAIGLINLLQHPDVLRAVNPIYAYQLLIHYPQGFWILGAVFLCATGAEALYSDLGHCGKNNIRISWIYVKSCLIINYLGQGAWVLNENITVLDGKNPFFEMMPYWFLLPGIIIAT